VARNHVIGEPKIPVSKYIRLLPTRHSDLALCPPNVIVKGHPRESARQTSAVGASAVREVAGGICNFFLQVSLLDLT